MTTSTLFAFSVSERWNDFWHGSIGEWILTRGVRVALLLIGGLLAARFISWAAARVVRHIDVEYEESDAVVRSEDAKHRQAVASVISWVAIALLSVVVIVEVTDILAVPVGSLIAPAAVLGAAVLVGKWIKSGFSFSIKPKPKLIGGAEFERLQAEAQRQMDEDHRADAALLRPFYPERFSDAVDR